MTHVKIHTETKEATSKTSFLQEIKVEPLWNDTFIYPELFGDLMVVTMANTQQENKKEAYEFWQFTKSVFEAIQKHQHIKCNPRF